MCAARRQRVVVDVTPLRSPSGLRGIGRYLYELLHGLANTRDDWDRDFEIGGLCDLPLLGSTELTFDLAAAADETIAQKDSLTGAQIRRRRQLRLGTEAGRHHADLLHVTEALGTPVRCPVPRLVTCYDLIKLRYPRHYLPSRARYPGQWMMDWRRYATADRVVTISEQTKRDVLRILRIPADRVEAVTTGIDLRRWTERDDAGDDERRAAQGAGERAYALYVGYGDYRKNVEGMFAALRKAREHVDLSLLWAGAMDDKRVARVRAQAADAGVGEHVRLLGYVEDDSLMALYRGAVAHLFISRLEGFGLTVVEAMALGCPVIVARRSGADEVAGQEGILVDADDTDGAAQALVRLASLPTERRELGERCRRQVQRFSRESMALGYIHNYQRALTDARG